MKPRTQAERAHHDAVAALGCWICHGPAEVHHLKHNPITGEHLTRRNHQLVIPLCPSHHRHGGWGVAYHAGSRHWESIYGFETHMWREVQLRLGIIHIDPAAEPAFRALAEACGYIPVKIEVDEP